MRFISASDSLRAARTVVIPSLLTAAILVFSACRPTPLPTAPAEQIASQEPSKTAPPAEASHPAQPVASAKPADTRFALKLYHAAQEMALDGFQFDKKALGWPHDAKVNSSGDFIAMLVKNNYLPADDIVEASGFMVSNLSDSDPGETAFLRTVSGISPTVVLRKDGQCKSFRDFAAIESFALSPSHEPAWLP